MKYYEIKKLKQSLRNSPTSHEEQLWKCLRKRQLQGRKFLRQHAIIYDSNNSEYFFYIPDFFCYKENLAIELDGNIHKFQIARDNKKDEILYSERIKVLRIRNEELENMDRVLEKIKSCFQTDEIPNSK